MEFVNKHFTGADVSHRRATYKGCGYDPQDLNRPHIGIANTFSEASPGHAHLRPLVDAIKAGIWQAGGIPFEFGVPSVCGDIALGKDDCLRYDTAMRDVVCASIELVAHIHRFDGLVVTSSCDNIVPGTIMAAERVNVPTLVFTGGPMLAGNLHGQALLLGDINETSFSNENDENRAALQTAKECSACPTAGACPLMGTANTMQILAEGLGLMLPGTSTIPGVFTDKTVAARHTGRRIVEMVLEGLKPSDIITKASLLNTMRLDMAIGGSTNAVLHLLAFANELDIPLTLDEFDRESRRTPCIVNCQPSGCHSVDELYPLGGVPAVQKQIEPLLDTTVMTATGRPLADTLAKVPPVPVNDVIRDMAHPISPEGGLAILRGNLAEKGAVVRASSVKPSMYKFRGRARVFNSDAEGYEAIAAGRIRPGDVIVLRYCGPVGAPGMIEVMQCADAIPARHMDEQVALVTDGRFSGFNKGPIIGHVAPEAAVGGVIALVEDGDIIDIDIPSRRLELLVDEETLAERRKNLVHPPLKATRGFMRTFAKNCLSADRGGAVQDWT